MVRSIYNVAACNYYYCYIKLHFNWIKLYTNNSDVVDERALNLSLCYELLKYFVLKYLNKKKVKFSRRLMKYSTEPMTSFITEKPFLYQGVLDVSWAQMRPQKCSCMFS